MRGLSLKTYKRIEQILSLLRENQQMHVRGIARALNCHPFIADKIITDYLDFFLEKQGVNIYGFRAVLVRFKPGKENAPSNLATVSSYLLVPEIFEYLDEVLQNLGEGEEFYYNDALKLMMADGHRVLAAEIKGGTYYDTGNKIGYLRAVIDAALEHDSVNGEFKEYIKEIAKKL